MPNVGILETPPDPCRMIDDKRTITGFMSNIHGWHSVGSGIHHQLSGGEIEKIIAYHELGERDYHVWLAVYVNGKVMRRYNSSMCEFIEYNDDQPINEDIPS